MKTLLFFCLPLKFLLLTSGYGYRVHPVTGRYKFHQGIDLRASHDTVFAIAAGWVTAGYDDLNGIYIQVSDSVMTCTYGHLSQVLAGPKEVPAGAPIAITGATGRVTGEHLHLTIRYRGHPIDPLKFLYQLMQQQHE